MPRYNVEHNGKWACFSSISDGFITEFINKSEYEEWRKEQYGEHGHEPAEKRNMITMKEAAFFIRLNRTHEEAMECLLECGLPESECEQIMYDSETEYNCPILKDDGKYECPNCSREVDREQRSCEGDDCCLDFVWRS
jgi:hypothetical protein